MFTRAMGFIRNRWHPLWHLRQSLLYQHFQKTFDFTVYSKIPGTDLRVAVKLLRDASWLTNPEILESDVRAAFTLVLEQLKPKVFWDVGANIGFYSWFVRRYPSIQEVVMFEPDPTNFGLLIDTIRKNALSGCLPKRLALSNREGEARFLVDAASGACGSLQFAARREDGMQKQYRMTQTIGCQMTTIDAAIAGGIPAPDFIKIDVEGAEQLVIEGGDSFLKSHRPALIVETDDANLTRKFSRETDYSVFRIDSTNLLFLPVNTETDLVPFARSLSQLDRL